MCIYLLAMPRDIIIINCLGKVIGFILWPRIHDRREILHIFSTCAFCFLFVHFTMFFLLMFVHFIYYIIKCNSISCCFCMVYGVWVISNVRYQFKIHIIYSSKCQHYIISSYFHVILSLRFISNVALKHCEIS